MPKSVRIGFGPAMKMGSSRRFKRYPHNLYVSYINVEAVGYRSNCLDEPVFMAGPKPMLTEFGIHHGLESCDSLLVVS